MTRRLRRRRADLGLIVALAWLGVALGLTVAFGGELGLRGWVWLGVHHVLCGVGCSHELWRAWRRRRARLAEDAITEAGQGA